MGAALVGLLTALTSVTPAAGPLRVLVVMSDDAPSYHAARDAFVEVLRADGQTVETEARLLSSGAELDPSADVVLALGTAAARRVAAGARGSTGVFAVVGDPISAGLADGGGQPRTALGGVSALAPIAEQLAMIRAAVPQASRLGVVVNTERTGPLFDAIVRAAAGSGLTVVPIAVRRPEDVGAALRVERDRFDTILALPDPSVWNGVSLKAAVIFSLSERRPLFGFSRAFTRAGALASLSAEDYRAMGTQAARLVIGRRAGTPPRVEVSGALTLSLNVVVAQRLGLTLPRSLTDRAQDVYR